METITRTLTTRLGALAAVALLAFTAAPAAQARDTAAAPRAAAAAATSYFQLRDYRDTFVIQLTDPAKIDQARDIVSAGKHEIMIARIAKSSAPYNRQWSFRVRPDTVDFVDAAIEVCDASISYVEDHLDEVGGAFLPGQCWCPWSGRLTAEVPAP